MQLMGFELTFLPTISNRIRIAVFALARNKSTIQRVRNSVDSQKFTTNVLAHTAHVDGHLNPKWKDFKPCLSVCFFARSALTFNSFPISQQQTVRSGQEGETISHLFPSAHDLLQEQKVIEDPTLSIKINNENKLKDSLIGECNFAYSEVVKLIGFAWFTLSLSCI